MGFKPKMVLTLLCILSCCVSASAQKLTHYNFGANLGSLLSGNAPQLAFKRSTKKFDVYNRVSVRANFQGLGNTSETYYYARNVTNMAQIQEAIDQFDVDLVANKTINVTLGFGREYRKFVNSKLKWYKGWFANSSLYQSKTANRYMYYNYPNDNEVEVSSFHIRQYTNKNIGVNLGVLAGVNYQLTSQFFISGEMTISCGASYVNNAERYNSFRFDYGLQNFVRQQYMVEGEKGFTFNGNITPRVGLYIFYVLTKSKTN